MKAVRVTLTTRNYPGRLHIPVCIIPCAKSSTADRLVPFSQQATPPSASLSRSSTNTRPPPPVHNDHLPQIHTLFTPPIPAIPPLPPLLPPNHPPRLDTSLTNPPISRAVSASASSTLVEPSVAGSGNGPRRFSDSDRPMPGFRRGHSLQVQDRACPCPPPRLHTLVLRSSPFIARVRPAPTQHWQSSSCPRILTARPLCTPPSFRAPPKPSGTHHTLRHRQGLT
jgi:hypothetical protein